ncbi:MAG: DUF58 domain-containing protein [Clostridia bacterium]|nr:DUF58 domain-containing protein [Clostridia bacterium]
MTARGFYTLLFGALMMVTALSVGSAGAFLLGVAALFAWALGLLSVLTAMFTCRLEQDIPGGQAERGDVCRYTLRTRLATFLPIAPLSLRMCLPSGRQSEFMLSTRMIGTTESENDFSCPHVGVFPVGITQVGFGDCFGLFAFRHRVRQPLTPLTVLPCPAQSGPLTYSPGEGESTATQRAQADYTTPSDTRTWQDGDELKRVHWKLSMRRQELMVRTYETPQRPDALVLLDCAAPQVSDSQRPAVIDALTETSAGVLKALLDARHIARLPLSGSEMRELSGQEPEALPGMLSALAQERFAGPADFSSVLLLASRRMRRTGSTAIVTARLTPAIADAVIALGRMGPHTRFTLVTAGPLGEAQDKLMRLLEASGIETEHVPAC